MQAGYETYIDINMRSQNVSSSLNVTVSWDCQEDTDDWYWATDSFERDVIG